MLGRNIFSFCPVLNFLLMRFLKIILINLFLFIAFSSFGQKSNSLQIGWYRAWQDNWGVSYRTMELKYIRSFTDNIGMYASLSNYFKSDRVDNYFTIVYNGDTIVHKSPFSISRHDTEKYPFISEKDYENLKNTGVLPLTPKELRQQLYIFEVGLSLTTDILFNHHQLGFQAGVNLTYLTMKDPGNVRNVLNLYFIDKDEELSAPLYEYYEHYRNIDLCFGVGVNYKYYFNERSFLGIELNLHNGLFITLLNDSLIPGYLGLGLVSGSKF